MKIAPLAEVKARLSAFIEACTTEGPVIITRNGRPVAVLVAPTDEDDLERLVLARSPQFRALLEQSRSSVREGKGISEETFWNEVDAGSSDREEAP